jgi:exosortase/archaeosortase family protein
MSRFKIYSLKFDFFGYGAYTTYGAYLFFFLLCQYSFLSIFYHFQNKRQILLQYAFALFISFGAAFLLFRWEYPQRHLWQLLGYGVGRIVYFLLKMTGFRSASFAFNNSYPVVGTENFKVAILYLCSGVEGIITFLIAFLFIVLFNWGRIDKKLAFLAAYCGVLIMYIVNVIRIYLLIVLGHITKNTHLVDFFHSQGSFVLYVAVIIIMLKQIYKRIILEK